VDGVELHVYEEHVFDGVTYGDTALKAAESKVVSFSEQTTDEIMNHIGNTMTEEEKGKFNAGPEEQE